MPELQYIEVTNLFPHPDNPRKEIGDVSELAESIKQTGFPYGMSAPLATAISPGQGSQATATTAARR